jgi:hypothetical protein
MPDGLHFDTTALSTAGMSGAALITAPADLAEVLHRASPERAHRFALTMHERACMSGDDDAMDLWGSVVALLRR